MINVVPIAPYFSLQSSVEAASPSGNTSWRLMVSNILTSNRNYQEAIQTFKKVNPDFLLVLEVDDNWNRQLDTLNELFPYSERMQSAGNFGLALFSKYPISKIEIQPLGDFMTPMVMAQVRVEDRLFAILGTHPVPPVGKLNSNKETGNMSYCPN